MINKKKKTFWDELLFSCPPKNTTFFGAKTEGLKKRNQEAKTLTKLITQRKPFCFLRMGDMELRLLLSYQAGRFEDIAGINVSDGPLCGTIGIGNPGLGCNHLERLQKAYEQADYVDFHEGNWPNEHLAPLLKLNRAPGTHRNPDKSSSLVFLAWLENEFREYCEGRRIGFAGAEAALLSSLTSKQEFLKKADRFWPRKAEAFFHQVRNNGRYLDQNLDLVKDDLREFVASNQLDTLFLSLGGGAKIIGFELSREMGIRCFDFGSLTRALTYSGCDGNRFSRSPHYPFLYRLPFALYMDCLEKAMPEMEAAEILAKAHGQLIQEVVRKEVGWSHASMEYDFTPENLAAFREAYQAYHKRYKALFDKSPATKQERAGFLHFCGNYKLTMEGRLFFAWLKAKSILAILLRRGVM